MKHPILTRVLILPLLYIVLGGSTRNGNSHSAHAGAEFGRLDTLSSMKYVLDILNPVNSLQS